MPITGQSANTGQLNLSANSVATINQDLIRFTEEVDIGVINLAGNSLAISINENNSSNTINLGHNILNRIELSGSHNAAGNIDIANSNLNLGSKTNDITPDIIGASDADNKELKSIKISPDCNVTFRGTITSTILEVASNASFNFVNQKFSFLNDINSNIVISGIGKIHDIDCRGPDIPGDILPHFEIS